MYDNKSSVTRCALEIGLQSSFLPIRIRVQWSSTPIKNEKKIAKIKKLICGSSKIASKKFKATLLTRSVLELSYGFIPKT